MLAEVRATVGGLSRRVGDNFAALLLGEACARGLTFAASLYLARRLGVERFGAVEIALALVVYAQLLVEAGLDTVATRAVARQPDARARYADNLAGMRLTLSAVAIALVALVTRLPAVPPAARGLLIGFSLALLPTAFSLTWSFQAAASMRPVAIVAATTQATYLALLLWLVRDGTDVTAVPWAYGAAALLGMLLLTAWHRRRFSPVRPRIDLTFWRNAAREALPILGARILRAISFNFDLLLIGAIGTTTAAAYYAAAYRFVLIPVLAVATFYSALFPVLVTTGEEHRRRLVRILLAGITLVSVAAAVGLTLIAQPLLTTAMGPAYAPAAGVLRWLAWSIPLIAVAGLFRQVLLVRHLQRIDLAAVSLGAVLNVGLNLVLVPRFGVLGAAAATLAGEAAVLVAALVGLWLSSPADDPGLSPDFSPAGRPGISA